MAKDKHTSIYFDRENSCFVGIQEANLQQLKETYANIDVDLEIKKMSLWLLTPNGKKRKGHFGFILNWLNNAKPTSNIDRSINHGCECDTPLRPWLNDYLRELWKDREHILQMNKKNN